MAKITRQSRAALNASTASAATTVSEGAAASAVSAIPEDKAEASGTSSVATASPAAPDALPGSEPAGNHSEDTPREPAQGGSSDPAAPAGEDLGDRYPMVAAAFEAWRGENLPAGVRITSLRDGFRRAGIAHTKLPVDHTFDSLGPWEVAVAKLEQLLGESNLKVELI